VRVTFERRTAVHRKSGDDAVTGERHEYEFDWSVK
jgi:hypothetical protein